jgi:hypothetical protein
MSVLELEKSLTIKEVSHSICDVSLYYRQWQETLEFYQGDKVKARRDLQEAVKNDGYGLIVENIIAQKNELDGKYLFDDLTRASVQLTPIKHEYDLEEIIKADGSKGYKIVPPEYRRQGKDVREVMTSWRRGLDIRSMNQVEKAVLDNEVREITWASPKAEGWEGELINKYNGEYGYLYKGQIEGKFGFRKLVVLDYRLGFQTAAFDHFIKKSSDKIYKEQNSEDLPVLDQVMSSVSAKDEKQTEEQTWKGLVKGDLETGGDGRVWGLELGDVLKLQNRQLHEHLKEEAAERVAEWLVEMIEKGEEVEKVQALVKERYILETQRTIIAYKLQSRPSTIIHEDKIYKDSLDPRILVNFTGFGGLACGDWGASSFQTFSGFGLSKPGEIGGFALRSENKKCQSCYQTKSDVECGYCKSCAKSLPR